MSEQKALRIGHRATRHHSAAPVTRSVAVPHPRG